MWTKTVFVCSLVIALSACAASLSIHQSDANGISVDQSEHRVVSHDSNSSHGSHGVHVVSWNYDYVKQPLLLSLFILLAGVLKLVFHYVEWLSSVVPESCLLIIFGTVMGTIVHFAIESDSINLEPRMFMLFLLPPIVLDSAYGLNDRVFFNNIGTILLYALLGTILNCFMIGPSLYGLSLSGAMGDITITFIQCQLFASFIVAVDPVAVLAIFQEVGVNDVLYFLVFGESLLNDAITIVLYNTMKTMSTMDEIPPTQVALAFASFFTVSLGGLSIGIIFGMLSALFTRTTSHVRIMEPLALFVFAYLSYLGAELLHWSGIVSLIACGLVQSQYAFHNISRKSLTTVKYFIKMISATSDAIIFLFLGLELIRATHVWHTGFVLWSLVLCLVYRLIVTCGLTKVANRLQRIKPISMREQFIMWYGGLRGAVCFALCDTLSEEFPLKDMFLTTSFVIIIFTVFVQGITIKPLVVLFNIKRKDTERSLTMSCEIQKHVTDHLMAGTQAIIGQNWRDYYVRQLIVHLNDNYFRHWFQTNPRTQDEQLLDTYQKIAIKAHIRHIKEATGELHPAERGMQHSDSNPLLPHTANPNDDDVFIGDHDRARQNRARRNWSKTYAALRRSGDDLLDDFRIAMEKKSTIRAIHHTYDKNLTRPEDTDFESQLREKHRRLRTNQTFRHSLHGNAMGQSFPSYSRGTAPAQRAGQLANRHTVLGNTSMPPLLEDEPDGRGRSRGNMVEIEMEPRVDVWSPSNQQTPPPRAKPNSSPRVTFQSPSNQRLISAADDEEDRNSDVDV